MSAVDDALIRDLVAQLRERITTQPRVMLILGSGLGGLADELEDAERVPFASIRGFPQATVAGHRGALVAGRLNGVDCIALQGRFHLYEGHAAGVAALPVRVMAGLGARALLVTNAAGGANEQFRAGDLMLIEDHINFTGRNPLVGPTLPGDERFPDMTRAYDDEFAGAARRVARDQDIELRSGVYAAVLGPSYETPAEVRMLRALGADAVGMSTVPEVIAARAMGVRVLGISLISNAAAGLSAQPLHHEEVLEAAEHARDKFGRLVRGVVPSMAAVLDES